LGAGLETLCSGVLGKRRAKIARPLPRAEVAAVSDFICFAPVVLR
jgi:hypothetical protein